MGHKIVCCILLIRLLNFLGFHVKVGRLLVNRCLLRTFEKTQSQETLRSGQILQNRFLGTKFLCLGEDDKSLVVAYLHEEINEGEIKKLLYDQVKLHPASVKIKKISHLPLSQNGKV